MSLITHILGEGDEQRGDGFLNQRHAIIAMFQSIPSPEMSIYRQIEALVWVQMLILDLKAFLSLGIVLS